MENNHQSLFDKIFNMVALFFIVFFMISTFTFDKYVYPKIALYKIQNQDFITADLCVFARKKIKNGTYTYMIDINGKIYDKRDITIDTRNILEMEDKFPFTTKHYYIYDQMFQSNTNKCAKVQIIQIYNSGLHLFDNPILTKIYVYKILSQ